ncbi:alpha/beta fold hydrolase [Microbacterium aurum]
MGLRRGVLVAVLAVVAAGCAAEGENAGEPMPPAPSGLEKFYEQAPAWGNCVGFGGPDDRFPPNAECVKITVPVDYSRPDGPLAQIALTRIPASGQKIGSLLLNPGGPGVSGLAMAGLANRTELSERFDRVGFDPRGVGASTPSITCLTPQEADSERAEPPLDNTPEGIAAAEAENREYADRCVARTGPDLLAHVGTREVVQDLDVIRAVLGDPKLTYLGYSYGTKIGSLYAERYPDRVRALVLDGAVDSSQDPGAGVAAPGGRVPDRLRRLRRRVRAGGRLPPSAPIRPGRSSGSAPWSTRCGTNPPPPTTRAASATTTPSPASPSPSTPTPPGRSSPSA